MIGYWWFAGIFTCVAAWATVLVFATVDHYVTQDRPEERVEMIQPEDHMFTIEEMRIVVNYHGKPLFMCWDKDRQDFRFYNYKGELCTARAFEVLEERCKNID